jgi:ABC-type dipeptide/oligopeptide/nickel transport system ATPase component
MRNGVIVEEGQCEEIFTAPKSAYTRLLIDAIPLPKIDPGWLDRSQSDAVASETQSDRSDV